MTVLHDGVDVVIKEEYRNKIYHLRDDKLGWSEIQYTVPRFQIANDGPYQTLDGKRAKKVTKYEWNDNHLYESDIDRYTALLIEKYKNGH